MKEKGRLLEAHLTIDQNGCIQLPVPFMEALGISPGDRIFFSFADAEVTVKGEKRDTPSPASTLSEPLDDFTTATPVPLFDTQAEQQDAMD